MLYSQSIRTFFQESVIILSTITWLNTTNDTLGSILLILMVFLILLWSFIYSGLFDPQRPLLRVYCYSYHGTMLNFLCRVLMILFLLVIDHRCRGQEFQILVIKTIPPNDLAILFIECSHLENLSLDRSTSSLSKKWLLISLKRSILFLN